jgi:ATP-binding cassette subfamily B (MDR/TAP) protein 1
MLGIVGFAARMGQGVCFSYSSERLTRRARDQSFRCILRQDIGFFDEKQNSTGALTAFLSTHTTHLNSLGGAVLGPILSFVSTITGGIILSLAIGWKLALVCSATIPVVAGCGWVRLKMLALFDNKIRKTHEEAATYASQAVSAIRTVASLGLEEHVLDHYSKILNREAAKSLRSILQASTLYAASQSCVFLCAALGFWYGGTLISSHQYTMLQFFICFAALISGSQSAGAIFSFAPDMSKATHAARDLKVLFERRPEIDTWDPAGKRIEKCDGRIEIENISFRYPTRPERLVLDNFSLSIKPGQHVALVGPSGCGKSTIISLLERFFDPVDGQIRVDGEDISKLNINDYRRLISVVTQEPMVYHGTIRENVVLGSAVDVPEEAIVQACKEANLYDFVMSLPYVQPPPVTTAFTNSPQKGGVFNRSRFARQSSQWWPEATDCYRPCPTTQPYDLALGRGHGRPRFPVGKGCAGSIGRRRAASHHYRRGTSVEHDSKGGSHLRA